IIALENKNNKSIYTASKAGLAGFSKGLKMEATKHNISILDVYITRTRTKQEYKWGMDQDYVAEKIFEYHNQPIDELVIDGRPLNVRKQKTPLRINIDARDYGI
ncbi:MAG: SDR family NAD(P)-dependent oxidoreductase, partial [Nanoarchaeota archaeon]|nr:SDR family NAD(P)-dependent oxidoreductase [Nanoarchaeota archaeon]